MSATRDAEQDHVDRRLRELNCGDLPDLDPDVEGIVERIQGINKRLHAVMEETLGEHDLSYGEWRVLCALRRRAERASAPGELAAEVEVRRGAVASGLGRVERGGLLRGV